MDDNDNTLVTHSTKAIEYNYVVIDRDEVQLQRLVATYLEVYFAKLLTMQEVKGSNFEQLASEIVDMVKYSGWKETPEQRVKYATEVSCCLDRGQHILGSRWHTGQDCPTKAAKSSKYHEPHKFPGQMPMYQVSRHLVENHGFNWDDPAPATAEGVQQEHDEAHRKMEELRNAGSIEQYWPQNYQLPSRDENWTPIEPKDLKPGDKFARRLTTYDICVSANERRVVGKMTGNQPATTVPDHDDATLEYFVVKAKMPDTTGAYIKAKVKGIVEPRILRLDIGNAFRAWYDFDKNYYPVDIIEEWEEIEL